MRKLSTQERKRLRELNQKNEAFNKNLWDNARSYAKGLFGLSFLLLIFVILYLVWKSQT